MPMPVSRTSKRTWPSARIDGEIDGAAGFVVLDGIVQEIGEDLAKLVRIGLRDDRLIEVQTEFEPARAREGTDEIGAVKSQFGDIRINGTIQIGAGVEPG